MPDLVISDDEIRRLADGVCDGTLDAAGYARLDDVLGSDLTAVQKYVEYISLDASVAMNQLVEGSPLQTTLTRVFATTAAPAKTASVRTIAAVVSAVCAACLLVAAATTFLSTPASPVARIVCLSVDADFSGDVNGLGHLLRPRDVLRLREGSATIRLSNGVLVDLSGPTSISIANERQVRLNRGQIYATVPVSGHGFTVTTSDCRVVDLGTEFFVRRSEDTATEVIVTEGEVNATLVDARGGEVTALVLLAGQAARLDAIAGLAGGIGYDVAAAEKLRGWRDEIVASTGFVRTDPSMPDNLEERSDNVGESIRVFRETEVLLDREVALGTGEDRRVFPAGTRLVSYLLHYDATTNATEAALGAIKFAIPIAAAATDEAALLESDALFARPGVVLPAPAFRGIEPDEDRASVSGDRHAMNLHFTVFGANSIDQIRLFLALPDPGGGPGEEP
ncbi:MAG: FecR domain-containing protein [Planctomycetota bacterium]